MAKHEADGIEKREKKEKKDKKRKHSESLPADTADADVEVVSERKKKDKKRKSTADGEVGDVTMDSVNGNSEVVKLEDDEAEEKEENKAVAAVRLDVPMAALVPFANPLCNDKAQKKVLKGVKKAAKNRAIKRGVKEVVKAVRKSPLADPSANPSTTTPTGLVILAADISPMDVISHIPVLCEDHGIPYVYVPSRAELGAAGSTKRPTSVVMLMPKAGKPQAGAGAEAATEEGKEEWEESYRDLVKVAVKLGQYVTV